MPARTPEQEALVLVPGRRAAPAPVLVLVPVPAVGVQARAPAAPAQGCLRPPEQVVGYRRHPRQWCLPQAPALRGFQEHPHAHPHPKSVGNPPSCGCCLPVAIRPQRGPQPPPQERRRRRPIEPGRSQASTRGCRRHPQHIAQVAAEHNFEQCRRRGCRRHREPLLSKDWRPHRRPGTDPQQEYTQPVGRVNTQLFSLHRPHPVPPQPGKHHFPSKQGPSRPAGWGTAPQRRKWPPARTGPARRRKNR